MAFPMRVKAPFAWGQRIFITGQIVSSDDPVMRRHAALFERVEVPNIEQATAAPGERRNVRRPTK